MSGFVGLVDSASNEVLSVNSSADGLPFFRAVPVHAHNELFNGSSWDRQRPNVDTAALVTLAAASAGTNSGDQANINARGLKLVIDTTAITGTSPTLTVTVQGKDAASGKYYTILASAALNAVATTVLTVYPGLTAAANTVAQDILPRTFRILVAIGGTTPAVTATIGASLIV